MKFFAFLFLGFFFLIAALVAVAFICDKLKIGNSNTAQPAPTAEELQQYWSSYTTYVQAMIDCVSNNFSSCGLNRPGSLPQHMAPYSKGISYSPEYGVVYLVFFDRGIEFNGGGGLNNSSYSTMSIYDIARKINLTFPNFCIANGCAPYRIVKCRDMSMGRVCFAIAPVKDVKV